VSMPPAGDPALAAESVWYGYARRCIPCACPLCRCPAAGGDWYSFVYVHEEAEVVYFDVPKCASTTIRFELFDNDNAFSLRNPRHSLEQYLTFTFVRNPWDRLVSTWQMFTTDPRRVRQLQSMTDEDLSAFEAFVDFARDVPNHHWQRQVLFLPERVDVVGRLETFDDDFARVLDRLGLPPRTAPRRRAGPPRRPYRTYYTPALAAAVGRTYADDVDAFGYRFDDGT
jgi:hypothetical protein